jgi:hypothetical protein
MGANIPPPPPPRAWVHLLISFAPPPPLPSFAFLLDPPSMISVAGIEAYKGGSIYCASKRTSPLPPPLRLRLLLLVVVVVAGVPVPPSLTPPSFGRGAIGRMWIYMYIYIYIYIYGCAGLQTPCRPSPSRRGRSWSTLHSG